MEEEKQHADVNAVKIGDAGSRGSLMKHLGEQEKERYKQLLQKYAEGQPVICQAAREGNLDDVKYFVEVVKEDVNQVAVGGVSPLIMASWANKIEVVNYLVSLDEVDVNMSNHSGATALLWSLSKGHDAVAKVLLDCPKIDLLQADAKSKPPIWYASKFGRTDILTLMLQKEIVIPSIYFVNDDGETAISSAASSKIRELLEAARPSRKKPNEDEVKAVKQKYGDVDPLCKAAQAGNVEACRILIDSGEDINRKAPKVDQNTPLARAAASGHVEVCKLLLEQPEIDVNKGGYYDRSPLLMASWEGHEKIVTMLLAHPNIRPSIIKAGQAGNTPLSKSKTKSIKKLITKYIDEHLGQGYEAVKWKYGADALEKACKDGASEDVEVLINGGEDVNAKAPSDNHNTPLTRACANGKTDCVRLLLQSPSIDVNLCGYNDRSPLLMCAWEGHEECVRMLCERPEITPSLTKKGKAGHTPLSKAKTAAIKKIIMDAIKNDSKAEATYALDVVRKKYGVGPLALAAKANNIADLKALMNGGEDVNQVANQGNTALIYASWKGHKKIVSELLKMPDIDLSQQNDNGDTALIQAVWKGHKDITRMLLSDKRQMKSINVKSKSGKSAWSVADSDLQELLKRYGVGKV